MQNVTAPTEALAVLAYGIKHSDVAMMDKVAKYTITLSPKTVFAALTPVPFLAWVSCILWNSSAF